MSRDNPHPSAGALQGDAALLRAIGMLALTAAVVNSIVGGGIFRMPSALATQMGAAAPLALIAGAFAIVPVALCFAAVGSRVQVTGGPYSYLTATYGPFAGFVGGALMWISNVASSAGVAAALAVQVANLVPAFASPLLRALLLTAVYGGLFALNAFGVKLGARAITALAALKLTPLLLLVALGIFMVDWSQVSFAIDEVPSWGALGASMVLVMFAYSGMETALIPSGEINDPARNVPRATMAAIALVVLLYLGLQIVGQGLLGAGPRFERRARRRHCRIVVGTGADTPARHRLYLDGRFSHGKPARYGAPRVRARSGPLPAGRARHREREAPRAAACAGPACGSRLDTGDRRQFRRACAHLGRCDLPRVRAGQPGGLARAVAGSPRARRSSVRPAWRRAGSGRFRGGNGRHRDDAHRARMGGHRHRTRRCSSSSMSSCGCGARARQPADREGPCPDS